MRRVKRNKTYLSFLKNFQYVTHRVEGGEYETGVGSY